MEGSVLLGMGRILLTKQFQNRGVAGGLCQFHHLLGLGIDLQLALIVQNDPLHQILLGIVILRGGGRNNGSEVCDIQKAGLLRNQFVGGGEAAAITEGLTHIGFHHPTVILGAIIAGTILLIGDGFE